jgi:hypothetical protein
VLTARKLLILQSNRTHEFKEIEKRWATFGPSSENDFAHAAGRCGSCAELCRKIFENMQAGTVERSKKRAAA